jgi:hypothetical protein
MAWDARQTPAPVATAHPVVRQIQASGATTFRAIAAALNDCRGVRTTKVC